MPIQTVAPTTATSNSLALEHPPRTVTGSLLKTVASAPDRDAILFEQQRFTYRELLAEARRMLGAYERAGLHRGDRLLILLSASPTYIFAWLGAALGGIVEVPLNTDYQGQMLRYVIEDCAAKTILTEDQFLPALAAAASTSGSIEHIILVDNLADHPLPPDVRVSVLSELIGGAPGTIVDVKEHEPIAVMYTSGTTGPSKGAVIAHRHAWEYAQTASILELKETDVYYAPLPLFHTGGQWACGYASFQVGAACVVKRRFSVGEFWDDVRQYGATVTFLLGAMVPFLQSQEPTDQDSANPLERVLMIPMIKELANFKLRFGVEVCTCYGSSDGNCPIWAPLGVIDSTLAGRVREGYEVRLVDENDEEVNIGEVGECIWRATEPWKTTIEYVGKPEATAKALRNMWFHSGDGLRMDAEGHYYFVDRLTDALRRRGENISSFEVEREAYSHPAVLECAAIGVRSRYLEDDLVVVAVPKPNMTLDPQDLQSFLKERAPRFMLPDRIEVIDEMPKTPTDKIKKAELRERFSRAD